MSDKNCLNDNKIFIAKNYKKDYSICTENTEKYYKILLPGVQGVLRKSKILPLHVTALYAVLVSHLEPDEKNYYLSQFSNFNSFNKT